MTKRMLIDGTHAEETRVVVLDGNRLEDFDVETSTKKQLKGNIYLAKIVRVEPSLQAAFVEYGGSRHGFLAFGEIHPDYYQIPVADRERLIAQQEQEAREAEEADEEAARAEEAAGPATPAEPPEQAEAPEPADAPEQAEAIMPEQKFGAADTTADPPSGITELAELGVTVDHDGQIGGDAEAIEAVAEALNGFEPDPDISTEDAPTPRPQTLGGEGEAADDRARRAASRSLRNYKIQEVIRRRQILLVQVVKEERGGKGAALTTYISLAGRFCVLMPNSPRGGGISRKITSAADRRRLKEITTELALPSGMGLIVRTAGAARPKPEITRDCEYLLQLWDDIRDTTMKSVAPALIYEEASLIKRAIRDVYSRDVDEVQVDGEGAWRAARDQMRLLMPSHVNKVQLWQDTTGQALFAHHQVDVQLDAMLVPTVQLRSGGYLVINQTEALVAVDVNSGRSTRERGIEETALRTNMEAAEEVARQLRLRDLAGLIVIDFIDMESRKHNAMVERKLADALKLDRARIQLGSISAFGLMELSRQRLRPSLTETSFVPCPHCGGAGHIRSTEGSAIQVLRAIEEEGGKRRSAEIMVHVAGPIAMYILNHKRDRLREIETRYAMTVLFTPDPTLLPPALRIDKLRAYAPGEIPAITAPAMVEMEPAERFDPVESEDERFDEAEPAESVAASAERAGETAEGARRRRRRRRRGGRREDGARLATGDETLPDLAQPGAEQPDLPLPAGRAESAAEAPAAGVAVANEIAGEADPVAEAEDGPSGRRRGRRGGRRRRREGEPVEALAEPPPPPAYTGPTPANPFGPGTFDIFDALEQAEAQAEAALAAIPSAAAPAPVPILSAEPEPPAPPLVVEVSAEPIAEPEPELEPAPEPAEVAPPPARPKRRSRAVAKRPAAVAADEAPVTATPEPSVDPAPAASRLHWDLGDVVITAPDAGTPGSASPNSAWPEPEPAEPAAPRRGWWRR